MNELAASSIDFGPLRGYGTLGLEGAGSGSGALNIFAGFISTAIGLMTIIAIIWFVFVFFTGAIGIITAGGDKQAMEGARKRITTGIIGLVVTIAAIFVIKLVGTLVGVPNILNISQLFGQITQ